MSSPRVQSQSRQTYSRNPAKLTVTIPPNLQSQSRQTYSHNPTKLTVTIPPNYSHNPAKLQSQSRQTYSHKMLRSRRAADLYWSKLRVLALCQRRTPPRSQRLSRREGTDIYIYICMYIYMYVYIGY